MAISGGLVVVVIIIMVSVVPGARGEQEETPNHYKTLLRVEYESPNLFPEGFDWDSRHDRFLVGSMMHGKLVAVSEKGQVEEFVKDEEYSGQAAILGVTVDQDRNRVLAVVSASLKGLPLAALVAYDLDSKKRVLYVGLNEDDPLSRVGPNDVTVDDDGNAYVTDSVRNSVWKVTLSGEKSVLDSSFPRLPVLEEIPDTSPDGGVQPSILQLAKTGHANGIVYHKGYLLISQTNSGALLRVNLADSKSQVVILPDGVVLPAVDGMAMRSDGALVVISFHTAWLLESKDSWRSAVVMDEVPLEKAGFTTTAAIAKELRIFTLHSHLPELLGGLNRESFIIQEIDFPSDSDNSPLWLLAILALFGVLVLAWKLQMNQFNKQYTKKSM